MEITFIIIAVLLGIILILVEILFVPGTTVVGVMGFILVGAGVYFSYEKFGNQVGHYTLVGSALICFALIYFGFKSSSWKFMANESVMESKVNEHIKINLKVGDQGESISALRPMGTASFNDEYFEVSTLGGFVEPKSKIKILEINNRQIIVEPLNS